MMIEWRPGGGVDLVRLMTPCASGYSLGCAAGKTIYDTVWLA